MKVTVIVDNNAEGDLKPEWGLSALIELPGATLLLDSGGGETFEANANNLAIDLGAVDAAVLSHAHYDHSDGFDAFFAANDHAPLYLSANCAENCYHDKPEGLTYIGIKKGLLERHAPRLRRVNGVARIAHDAVLVAHSTPGIEEAGRSERMFTKDNGKLVVESFAHELSLVVDSPRGICIFNSCSHAGIDVILSECTALFPDRPVRAYVGGLHLYNKTDEFVLKLGDRMQALGIEAVYSGHCTGDRAFSLLRERLGEKLHPFYAGLSFEL